MVKIAHIKFLKWALGFASILLVFNCGKDPVSTTPDKANVGKVTVQANAKLDTLSIVSTNLSVGWRAEDLLLNNLTDTAIVYKALTNLYAQYSASYAMQRMELLAQEIALLKPNVIALQETQVMKMGDLETESFVQKLLDVLDSLGQQYEVVAKQELNQINLDVTTNEGRIVLNFWEGNVTLAQKGLQLVDSSSGVFNEGVDFDILTLKSGSKRGWVQSKIATPKGGIWQIWNTHFEVELLASINFTQGQEFNALLWDAWQDLDKGAQVALGDLNSKPGKGGVSALISEKTGLVDLWDDNSGVGYTCCIASFTDPEGLFNRRIDYVLARNFASVGQFKALRVGSPLLWGTDHALLYAEIVQSVD